MVPPVMVHEAPGQAAGGKLRMGSTLLENDERVGAESKRPNAATVQADVAVLAEGVSTDRVGGRSTGETTSASSRPSELFDSLDLSAS